MKRILLVGKISSDSSIYTYATSFLHALRELGFLVDAFNVKRNYLPWPAAHHDSLPSWLKRINNIIINWRLKVAVRQSKADFVFVIKGENIFPTVIRMMQQQGCYVINFYPDNPFCLWNGNSTGHLLYALPLYDLFLIWSRDLMPLLLAAGSRRVEYFPFAYDPMVINASTVVSDENYAHYATDICFAGSWDTEREYWLTALCKAMPHLRIAIWGNGWDRVAGENARLRDCLRGIAIYGGEMVKLFKCSSIVLNFVRKQNMEGHNMRTFEALASGAFLITQRTKDQSSDPFSEDYNIVCFSTLEELIKKISYYLEHPEARLLIVQRGMQLAQEYTLTQQLKKALDEGVIR